MTRCPHRCPCSIACAIPMEREHAEHTCVDPTPPVEERIAVPKIECRVTYYADGTVLFADIDYADWFQRRRADGEAQRLRDPELHARFVAAENDAKKSKKGIWRSR